jgi:hypothetical protein
MLVAYLGVCVCGCGAGELHNVHRNKRILFCGGVGQHACSNRQRVDSFIFRERRNQKWVPSPTFDVHISDLK